MLRTFRSRFAARRMFLESLESRQLMAADLEVVTLPLAETAAELGVGPAITVAESGGGEFPHVGTFPAIPESAETALAEALLGGASAALAPLTGIPALNSLAGAAASLYLDFNGHFDTVWGAYSNISTPAFDLDGDATTFSDSELTSIRHVWAQVAEDFAPFKINVTTVEPPSFANGVALRVAIGGNGSWLGGGAGGIAYINSFTNSVANTAYVFPKALGNGYFKYVAEAASHEAGHAFGLEHQSLFSATGAKLEEYNPGNSAVAPIMGNSYSATRGLWSRNYNADHVIQDDLALISRSTNGFGYRPDDHANTASGATALATSGSAVSASGIIHQTSDVDYFSFTTGAGQVNLSVNVVQFNNLDARLELRDAAGTLIASAAPTTSFGASITTTLAAGSYRLVVASQGNYGDLGQYTVSGTIVPVTVSTVAAPSDLTVTGTVEGALLTWSNHAAAGSDVLVERRAAGGAWTLAARLTGDRATYVDGTVAAGQSYEYRVQAATATANSAYSNVASVTFAPAAPTGLTATAVSGSQVNLSWANVSGETGYTVERLAGGEWTQIGTTAADATTYQDKTAVAGAAYSYRVRAFNAGGDSANSSEATVVTPTVITRPSAPSSLFASINSNRQVQLSWRDNSTNETVFVVQRSTNGSTWTTLGQVPANSIAAIDTTAARSRVYYYRVFAYNSAGYSAASNTARVTTPVFAARTTTSTLKVPVIQPLAGAAPVKVGKLPWQVSASKVRPQQPGGISEAASTVQASPSSGWESAVDAVFSMTSGLKAAGR